MLVAPERGRGARWQSRFDRIFLLTAPEEVKIARFVARSGGGGEVTPERRAELEAARDKIKGGADFAQVARDSSEDPQTASKGGELGLLAAGELTPELDKVVFGLKVGEVAGPVRTGRLDIEREGIETRRRIGDIFGGSHGRLQSVDTG